MLRINVLVHVHTAGLRRDLRVIRDVLRGRKVDLTLTAFDPATLRRLRRGARRAVNTMLRRPRYDINIFDETIIEAWMPFARVNCFLPHQEWLGDESRTLLPRIDHVLCKTRYAVGIFGELSRSAIFTGFTTTDRFDPSVPKDYGACVHIGGSSLQKGSATVNRVWKRHPEWPLLHLHWYESTARPEGAANIAVERCFVSERELTLLQNRCGIHLCPSEAEGFGHYLAEAMSSAAVVLTTDGPPMNEFIQNGRGVLVGYGRSAPQAAGMNFYVDDEKLARAVGQVLGMSDQERRLMGQKAREWYLENDRAFRDRFWEVLQGIA